MKKIISVLLLLSVIITPAFAYAKEDKPKIAYIPLDDRPGNLERVKLAAEAADVELLLPPEDYFHTSLDGQPLNSNGRPYGNTAALLDWIKETDAVADNFIISLDQLLSGGLVNSRVGGVIRNEREVIDKIISLSKTNRVYVFDTVVRLAACTIGYRGGSVNLYEYLRSYFDRNPSVINAGGISDYVQETVTAEYARQRKLELIKYMLRVDNVGRIKYYIGVDDSSSRDNIQLNEISRIVDWLGGRGRVYSGTDEIGIMMFADMCTKLYKSDIKLYVKYFGGNENSGTEYDFDTVAENVRSHIIGSGAKEVFDINEADALVLVMTMHDENGTQAEYSKALMEEYQKAKLPVIIIDSAALMYDSEEKCYHNDLPKMIMYTDTSKLLAFSCWNTGGNAVGMALGNGISRLAYLNKVKHSSKEAQKGYEKQLVFSFAKDIGYKLKKDGGEAILSKYISDHGYDSGNFYEAGEFITWAMNNGVLENCMNRSVENLRNFINGIEDGKIYTEQVNSIRLVNYRAPWYRTFEILFDIEVD
ncbi:MAG: DUF4127 family protein [Clostridiales bacterium]|nr:DUF4127 family protein [Clostridiales bacterium]